ncbi:lysozyme inhibitor LprI family protein [uncultured Ruegeria sp.]|uniref:lysozyme inhibitor LprI family protein n=1 Tax=uncultured Ruegeria sp. TaxID=259304 RepID=UPI002638FD36|nr:lysozyme inhibitor LprI family protein [uncultured Ruegeria sp.]
MGQTTAAYEIVSEQNNNYSIETDLIESCLADARAALGKAPRQRAMPDAINECIGIAAGDCMERTDYSTYGMIMCLEAESIYWKIKLEQNYSVVAEWAENLHGDVSLDDHAFKWTAPQTFEKMKAEWEEYTKAYCHFRASKYWRGTASGPTRGACWMRRTAEQALMMDREIAGICSWQQGDYIRETCNAREAVKP